MEYEVRRVSATEWQEYRRLRLEALQDSPLAFVEQYAQSAAQPPAHWQARVSKAATDSQASMFVAVRDDEFLGKASCFLEPEPIEPVTAHVVGVYVTASHRGRAVAEQLLAATIQWARQVAGAQRIRLFVNEGNARAEAFYRRIGFVPTGATMAYPPDPRYREAEFEYRGKPVSAVARQR